MTIEIKNAVIESARFDMERGLCAWVTLNYGGSGQGFGGWILYIPRDWAHHANQANLAGHFIWRVLEIAGVDDWSKLKGKTVRAKAGRAKVHAIGHIINDDWFDPEVEFGEMLKEEK